MLRPRDSPGAASLIRLVCLALSCSRQLRVQELERFCAKHVGVWLLGFDVVKHLRAFEETGILISVFEAVLSFPTCWIQASGSIWLHTLSPKP